MLKFLSPKQTNALVLRHYVVITLMHLNIHSPEYLKDLIIRYIPLRDLRSYNKCLLVKFKINLLLYGGKSFSVVGPNVWKLKFSNRYTSLNLN